MTDARLSIAFVVDRFGSRFGGAEAYGVALMRELAPRCDITVFAREYDAACDLQLPFIPMGTWRKLPSWVRSLLFALRARRLTRSGFDVVHSHMNGWCGDVEVVHVTPVRYNWRVRPLGVFKRAMSRISPRVQTYLGLEQRRVRQRPGHRVVAVSGLIADQLRQAYGDHLAAPVIPPGVVPPAKADASARQATRKALGWSETDVVCLLVARNPLRKGLPTMLKALARLPDNVKLLVVGGSASTRDAVVRFEANRLADRVHAISETPDVATYYRSADIYVHPTLNDSFGMAPLEAMSFGLPVVISPSPWCGFAHYLTNGVDALVLRHPEDDENLAQLVERLVEDQALRDRLAQGSRQIVEQHSWTRVAQSYLQLYRDILAERAQS